MCTARHLCNRKVSFMNSARSSLLMLWLQCKMKHQTIRHCYITYTILSSQFSQSLQTFHSHTNSRFEVFTTVKVQVKVFCVGTSCSVMVEWRRFRGPGWRWRQHGPLKRCYPTTTWHGVTTQHSTSRIHWYIIVHPCISLNIQTQDFGVRPI
jgi:hypothetical protein